MDALAFVGPSLPQQQLLPSAPHIRGSQAPSPQPSSGLIPLASAATVFVAARMRTRQVKTVMYESQSNVETTGKYTKLVQEDRMITVEESNLRYAGAALILLIGIYKYVGMMSAGVFNYTSIAADAAAAWAVFESGRQSL
ncbi:unnamed protein product [Durusdinium trenchii]|uniref:D-lactate dehydrogenase n=3 Tax=Durusdinium trenchii TaxID=1381693 RepID=A0ABP0HA84_9DINO